MNFLHVESLFDLELWDITRKKTNIEIYENMYAEDLLASCKGAHVDFAKLKKLASSRVM